MLVGARTESVPGAPSDVLLDRLEAQRRKVLLQVAVKDRRRRGLVLWGRGMARRTVGLAMGVLASDGEETGS